MTAAVYSGPGVNCQAWRRHRVLLCVAGQFVTQAVVGVPFMLSTLLRHVAQSFAGLLQVLRDNNTTHLAPQLRLEGILTPAALFASSPEALHRLGFVDTPIAGRRASLGGSADRRMDHPVIAHTSRGSTSVAAAALSTTGGRQAALSQLDSLMYANSSKRPRDSLWRTWCVAAATWGLPPLPLDVQLVRKVAAYLRTGGYRSSAQFFARARQQHVLSTGAEPSADVLLCIRQCNLAIERGIGPSALKDAFQFESLLSPFTWRTLDVIESLPSDSPVSALAVVVIGCWWFARGIELSAAVVNDVRLSPATKQY